MFNKLKEKLGSWLKATKEKLLEDDEEEKEIEVKSKPKNEKKETKNQRIKKLEKEIKKTEKIIKEVKSAGKKKKDIILEDEPKITKEIGKAIQIEQEIEEGVPTEQIEEDIEKIEKPTKKSFFSRLKESFSYKITNDNFNEIFDDLEMLLLENNVALEVVEDIKTKLSQKLIGKEIKKADLEKEIKTELKNTLNEIIIEPDNPIDAIKLKKATGKPFVILFFGINGTGKTTSLAKLTNLLQKNKLSVVLAAADTFRAASIEQIQIHADRLKVHLVKHDYGSDPSAVGFDAIKYAEKHNINVVLIDTAGRMHTKTNLLQEMEKICRVTNPDLKIFVAESIAGNDAVEQAKSFNEMIEIDGSILSKADIDEKGGTIISVSHATHKPIFYLGTGQRMEDIELFDKEKFIEKLGL